MPKGYLPAEFENVDPVEFEHYRSRIAEVSGAFGGPYLARRSGTVALDGQWAPRRMVLVEFTSSEQYQTFYDTSSYRAIPPHRLRSTQGHVPLPTSAA